LVDDEAANTLLLERLLRRTGYGNLTSTTNPLNILPLYREVKPDLILLDLLMPHLDGFAILELLAYEISPGAFVPRLVLTADITAGAKKRALALGATDFITKPFDQVELLLRVENALHARILHVELRDQNQLLEERVRDRVRELEKARLELVHQLSLVTELDRDQTGRRRQPS
jgi:putative two-component system response regulator